MAEIRLDGLGHRYGKNDDYALERIDLTWEDGGAYALLGPSGCGKSTMLNVISGLLRPSDGRVLFDGVDVTDRSTVDRNIAQVFQFPVLYGSMTVEQNMRFPLRNRGIAKRDAQRRAEEIAELLEIPHLLKTRADRLSADAKQLVSLSRALVRRDVSAILFDEPLTVIDPQKKWTLRQALKRVHTELNHTLVYVTHDQTEALTFADVVVVMNEGAIMQKGTPDELFERPEHRFVGHFIGSPGMNFLPCEVGDGIVRVSGLDLLRVTGSLAPNAADGDDVVGVRPDFVRCWPEPRPGTIEASVSRARDVGTSYLVDLQIGEVPLTARVPPRQRVPEGRCWVDFEPGRLKLFRNGHVVAGSEPTAVLGGAGAA